MVDAVQVIAGRQIVPHREQALLHAGVGGTRIQSLHHVDVGRGIVDEPPHVGRVARIGMVQFAAQRTRHRQPLGVGVHQVSGMQRRIDRAPDQVGIDPRVHRQAARARLLQYQLQRIELRLAGQELGARLQRRAVQRIGTPAHLHDQRVEAAGGRLRHHLPYGFRAGQRMAYHPHGAHLVGGGRGFGARGRGGRRRHRPGRRAGRRQHRRRGRQRNGGRP